MTKKTKRPKKLTDQQLAYIADLEVKLGQAELERIEASDDLRQARLEAKEMVKDAEEQAGKKVEAAARARTAASTLVNRLKDQLRSARAGKVAQEVAEASQPGRMGLLPVRAAREAVAMVPGAVDTDGVGKVVKAPTVAQVHDTLSRLLQARLITGAELATAREFQALFQQCSYGDMRAANLERVGVGSKPVVVEFAEDRKSEMNRLLRLLGGFYSPLGSILYHVVGMEEPMVAWCARQASAGERHWSLDRATGLLAAAITHLHVVWSFRHIVVIEDAVRGQLLKVGKRAGMPA